MFVRIKTTPNSPRRSVQLVEAVRDGGKVRQRIVRHIGVAMDEDELERLRQLGEYVKAKLIVVFCPERARKDAYERSKQVERLLDKLARSDNPKELLSNHGAKRFIAIEGDARLTVNPEKIAEAERWDGLAGVITNLRDASVTEVMAHYHGLWQVEESFRITKHDLRVRPIWHWNSEPDPRPHRHRLHGLCLRPPPRLPRRHPEAADVPGGDPLRPRPPPMLGPALPEIGQPLRHPLEADTGGGADLRGPWGCP